MASPVSSRSVTSGQEFEVVTIPLDHTPPPELPIRRVEARIPTVVHSAVSTAPRGKVAHPIATSAEVTVAGISQRLRSVTVQGDGLVISVPVYPEQRQPLGSLFDSLREFVEQEKKQMVGQSVDQERVLPPPRQPRPSRPQPQYQPPQLAYQYRPPYQPLQPVYQYPQQQTHQYPQCPPVPRPYYSCPAYPIPSTQARIDFLQRIHRPFPFKRESIQKIFKSLLKRADFRLPEPARPDEVGRTSDPTYCLYHRVTGHVLEDCVAFKKWLERSFMMGFVAIPDEHLVDSLSESTKVIFDLRDDMSDSFDD